jgi:hypothetical protein
MINDMSISLSSFNCAISLIASGVYKLYGNERELEMGWGKIRRNYVWKGVRKEG